LWDFRILKAFREEWWKLERMPIFPSIRGLLPPLSWDWVNPQSPVGATHLFSPESPTIFGEMLPTKGFKESLYTLPWGSLGVLPWGRVFSQGTLF